MKMFRSSFCELNKLLAKRFFFKKSDLNLRVIKRLNSINLNHTEFSSYSSFSLNKVKGELKNSSRKSKLQKMNLSTNTGTQSEDSYPEAVANDIVSIIFVTPEGEEIKVKAKVGEKVLNIAQENKIGCEGACDGQLACTTCHMYVEEYFEQFIEPPTDIEEDLLDCAPFLKPNSRLTCQIVVTKELNGARFVLPQATINFYVDGHKPTPH